MEVNLITNKEDDIKLNLWRENDTDDDKGFLNKAL